ncbi:unnamed protein product, partial [Allacma fusca]
MSFDVVRLSGADLNNLNCGKRRPLNPLNLRDRKNKINNDKGLKYEIVKGRRKGTVVASIRPPTGDKIFYVDLFNSFRAVNADQQNQILSESLEIKSPAEKRIAPENARKLKSNTY